MSSRSLVRVVLHLLLAAGLVMPGIAAPAQAVTQALSAVASDGSRVTHSPCDGMRMPMPDKAPAEMPAGMHHGCDLSSCLGAGCLPTLPHVAAFVPKASSLIAWDQPARPSRVVDTPLRPPIV